MIVRLLNLLFGSSGMSHRVPDEYREEYIQEFQRINLQSARVLTLVGGILVPASFVLDYNIHPDRLWELLPIRVGMSLSCFVLFGLSFVGYFKRNSTPLTMGLMFAVGGGIAYMTRVLGYEDPYYAGLNLVYLSLMIAPWGFAKTIFTCGVVYGCYLVPILIYDVQALHFESFVNNNVFQLETIFIVVVVNYFQSIRRRNEVVNRLTIAHQAKELEEIDKYKREFISNITHELKTPLAIVMGNADLILDKTDDDNLRGGIDLIRKAAFQLANHVDRIIAVSSVDDPDTKPDLGNYDYSGVVQNVFALFESRAREDSITYALNLPSGPLVVNIDVVKIEEVLSNLIQNAFKFTPSHGIITVTVSSDGERVFTEVSDSGVGIPQDRIGRIFDRMYQANEVLSKRHSGIGLGLYISRKNVELHGGEISAHSKQGKGTSFKFSLPLHIDQTADVQNRDFIGEERRNQPRRSGTERRSGFDRRVQERRFEYQQRMGLEELAKMTYSDNVRDFENQNPSRPTILVIEDNAGMMKVIVEALREDYNLLIAFDAFEAQRKLESTSASVSLILSDIMMPGMNGYDFLKKIMAREVYRHVPFIFITALMSQDDQLKGFALGATDYIVKPYNIKILKEKVDHWISRRRYEVLLKDATASLEERLAQLSKTKDIILHEIGNPIQMITGASYFVDKLRNISYDRASDQEKQLWKSIQALKHGVEAIQSVLETSKHLDVTELSMRRPENVTAILNEAALQTRHLLGDIDLRVQADEAGSAYVNCDKKMIVQVLVNLIRNGIEAIREIQPPDGGEIIVKSEMVRNRHIHIKVQDNGIGMDPEIIDNLFKFRFTNKKDGNGIGLHLSKIILKLHEGSIEAESRKGVGTTFTLSLPLFASRVPIGTAVLA